MTALLRALGEFLAPILRALFPEWVKEFKKPGKVEQVGGDPEVQADIEREIEKQLEDR